MGNSPDLSNPRKTGNPDDAKDPNGADDGIRTRDPHLGKVMLYQLSHVRDATDGNDLGCGTKP